MRRALILLAVLVLAACRPPEKPKLPPEPPPPKPTALERKPGPGVLIVCAPISDPDYGDWCVQHGGIAGVAAHGPVMCRDGEASTTCRCE
jgi:hypothetical protein